ncbi:hypothetical protein [Burkholderia sp. BCC0397]|uniref:hypothetical protein n=1 Tax=Burkholderia sp. BCC0397 TaxID=486876 RepID=UPI001FC7DC17|nr:hypothetical protein [Burkholderia sp. BCC0397]
MKQIASSRRMGKWMRLLTDGGWLAPRIVLHHRLVPLGRLVAMPAEIDQALDLAKQMAHLVRRVP